MQYDSEYVVEGAEEKWYHRAICKPIDAACTYIGEPAWKLTYAFLKYGERIGVISFNAKEYRGLEGKVTDVSEGQSIKNERKEKKQQIQRKR